MVYRYSFLVGLLAMLLGQILLAQGNDFVYNQKPIDFAHWSFLLGAVLLLPQIVSFPKKPSSYIGIPLSIMGVAATIGMCVLDFIFWSFPTEELRNDFALHMSQVPSIWKPFMSIGPSSKVFNLGLLLLAFTHIKEKKIGVAIILIANLILWHIIPIPYRLVVGYTLTLIGFSLVLLPSKKNSAK